MQKTVLILCLSAVTLLVGCHSGPEYRFARRKISIDTEPAGARVYQIGPLTGQSLFLGTTPLRQQSVAVLTYVNKTSQRGVEKITSQMEMARVRIEKEGFKDYESNLWTSEKETVKHLINLEPAQ